MAGRARLMAPSASSPDTISVAIVRINLELNCRGINKRKVPAKLDISASFAPAATRSVTARMDFAARITTATALILSLRDTAPMKYMGHSIGWCHGKHGRAVERGNLPIVVYQAACPDPALRVDKYEKWHNANVVASV